MFSHLSSARFICSLFALCRVICGGNALCDGPVEPSMNLPHVMAKVKARGFGHEPQPDGGKELLFFIHVIRNSYYNCVLRS